MVEFDPAVHAALASMVEYDSPAPKMAYRAHAAPAPMVEYDAALMMAHRAHAAPALMAEYNAALMVAHQAHVAPAPVVEYDAPAQTMAYQEHAASVTAVEYDASAPTVTHQVHAAPAPVVEYDASTARATPSPLVDGPIVDGRACSSGTGRGEDNRGPAVADYRGNCRYSRKPDCPKHREFGYCSRSRNGACGERTLRIPLVDCEGGY